MAGLVLGRHTGGLSLADLQSTVGAARGDPGGTFGGWPERPWPPTVPSA